MDAVKFTMIDPATVNAEHDRWLKVWNEVFLK
jgi:hypothetical protein